MHPSSHRFRLVCLLAGVLAAGARSRAADVSQDDFNTLRDLVRQQGEEMRKLGGQVRELQQAHAADQATHEKDVQQIQQLEQKLTGLQTATNAPAVPPTNAAPAPVVSVPPAAPQTLEVAPMPRVPIDEATVNHNFSILGDAEFQYGRLQGQHPTFLFADFAPIFLYRGGDKVLFEAGFDFSLQNNAPGSPGYTTTINLSFAQLDYVFSDYATLAVGNLLLPLGTYVQRGAGWLNKIPDDPLPRDLLPGNGVGAELLGAIPLGERGKMLNYAVYGVNGPGSADGTGNAGALDLGGNVGLHSDNAVANLHSNPSGGARVAFFAPFKPHYDMEIGLSGQSGEWDDAGRHLWSAAVVDAAFHFGSFIEAKGEFINSWYGSDDAGNVHTKGWWVQGGYKLAGLNFETIPQLSNLEAVGRYDSSSDGLGGLSHRYTLGFIYYFSNTLLLEGDYEWIHSNDPTLNNRLIFQLSYGF